MAGPSDPSRMQGRRTCQDVAVNGVISRAIPPFAAIEALPRAPLFCTKNPDTGLSECSETLGFQGFPDFRLAPILRCTERNPFPYTCGLRVIQTEFRARRITAGGGIRKRYDFRTSHCLYRKPVFTVPPKNGGPEWTSECRLPGPKRTLHGYVAYCRS